MLLWKIILCVVIHTLMLAINSTPLHFFSNYKEKIHMYVVEGAGRKAKWMVLQCINGVGLNPVEGRTKIWQF
jgi:hypothetical protein